jgi:hypothetical protein
MVLRTILLNTTEGAMSALSLKFFGRRYPTARKKSKIKGGRFLSVLFKERNRIFGILLFPFQDAASYLGFLEFESAAYSTLQQF